MADTSNNPLMSQMKADPFEFAARLKLVLEHTDEIRRMDLAEIQKLEKITRAATGACGVVCGGC